MKIYRVAVYDDAYAYYHCPTRKAAVEKAAEFRGQDGVHSVEIEAVEVEPTRAGIAEALQDLIDMTCLNEH